MCSGAHIPWENTYFISETEIFPPCNPRSYSFLSHVCSFSIQNTRYSWHSTDHYQFRHQYKVLGTNNFLISFANSLICFMKRSGIETSAWSVRAWFHEVSELFASCMVIYMNHILELAKEPLVSPPNPTTHTHHLDSVCGSILPVASSCSAAWIWPEWCHYTPCQVWPIRELVDSPCNINILVTSTILQLSVGGVHIMKFKECFQTSLLKSKCWEASHLVKPVFFAKQHFWKTQAH